MSYGQFTMSSTTGLCEHDKPTKILLGSGDEPIMLWCHNCGAIWQAEIDKWILPHFWSQLHDKPGLSVQINKEKKP